MKSAFNLFIIFVLSCSGKEVNDASNDFLRGVKLAQLNNKDLREISGMASSINNPKLLWVHNDAGNKAEIFLLDENLDVKLTCKLNGIDNRDWEDIAIGPGPDSTKSYIYVGEIGDNDARHRYKYIYRFEEPTWDKNEKSLIISAVDKIIFRLPDGPKDTETLLLDPRTKDLYVVSKREKPVYVYKVKYPYEAQDTITASKVVSLPFTGIVGGDFSAKGDRILLKNYSNVFYWHSPSVPVEELLKQTPKEVPYEVEPQGEAITWVRDGSGFYTLSEESKKEKSYLYFYKFRNTP